MLNIFQKAYGLLGVVKAVSVMLIIDLFRLSSIGILFLVGKSLKTWFKLNPSGASLILNF